MTTPDTTSVWEAVGTKPVINAQGHLTTLGGSSPSERVKKAVDAASHYYADMRELLLKTGEIIAPMLGAEAAFVTSGASSALNLGTAACISGMDIEKIERLPHSEGMNNEVVMFKRMKSPAMGYRYTRCFETAGGRLVLVGTDEEGTVEDMERAITPKTALLHYLGRATARGGVPPVEDVIALGKKHNVPVLVDAAGETWPLDGLTKYARAGADLVAYAAKYFNAPHSTGVLCGRKDLIDVAFKHCFIGFQHSFHGTGLGIGRGYKVERQEVIAVVEALKEWLSMNHEERLMAEDAGVRTIEDAVKDIPGVTVTRCVTASTGAGDPLPPGGGPAGSMIIEIDADVVGKTAADIDEELRAGNPMIYVMARRREPTPGVESLRAKEVLGLTMRCVKEGEAEIIAERLRAALSKK